MSVQIIAQVGDTHSLKFADMGKRRFLRLGASEKNPNVMQGTIHTGISLTFQADSSRTQAILANLGLELFTADHEFRYEAVSNYFVTGAIVYVDTASDGKYGGILMSVCEEPDDGSDDAEFDRQYPYIGPDGFTTYGKRDDNSIAKELDETLATWARGREIAATREKQPTHDQRAGRIAQLTKLRDTQNGLNAQQHAELDRLQNLQRMTGNEPEAAEDDEPEMLTGRLG